MQLHPLTTTSPHYPFVEALMQEAFPEQERRDADCQRTLTDGNSLFHANVLLEGEQPVGLLTYWMLADFCYVEHFAIDSRLRGGGYGSRAIEALKATVAPTPLVLEVEEPTDEASVRRIAFYRRQGFLLHEAPYLQPPYREGDEWFPLKLMSVGGLDVEGRFNEIRNLIYTHVYNASCD